VLFLDETPDAVAVSEAMNLVRDLSTEDSPTFVNGVLGNIVRDKATLVG
jgi:N utilization substance protein B